MVKIGIDLGGTKIEIIALNQHNEILFRERTATPQGQYKETLNSIYQLVFKAENQLQTNATVGIATPGAISPFDHRLRNSNSTCLNNQNIKDDLQNKLNRQIKMCNDADCFALSEAIDGNAKDYNSVFGVIIGTGTGAGIVINKQLLAGPNAIAGEWGHNSLPWPTPEELPGNTCYCGKNGCIETFLSGPGLSKDHLLTTNNLLTAQQVENLALQGDQQAEQTMQRYEKRLAKSLAHVINIIDPDIIVLGGGLSNLNRLYRNIPNIWGNYVFSDHVATHLAKAKHGDSSGVRGAAWLWN